MDSNARATRAYRVLSHAEREEIMIGLRGGLSRREIARRLARHPSVITREIRSNSTEDGRYQAYWAQSRSARRRRSSRQRPRVADLRVRAYIDKKLKLGWSPEQISEGSAETTTSCRSAMRRSTNTYSGCSAS